MDFVRDDSIHSREDEGSGETQFRGCTVADGFNFGLNPLIDS